MIIEEEPDTWQEEPKEAPLEETIPLSGRWKMVATTIFALMTLCTVAASAYYFRESGKNSQEEKKVAAGVADVAMALTLAELRHITPIKQNWADPEFLNSNIVKVVSPDLHPQAVIDHQGQFNDSPYLLRVYTKNDISHFLVIAQPSPNLHQWFVNKKAIVIDSKSMEIRKISDLKTLNRLLANPNPLAGANGEEISRLVKSGKLMPLSSLAGRKNRWGFTPPKELAKIKPGAENLIYNAPRYFPLGEAVLDQAVRVAANGDKIAFKGDLEVASEFPHLVLFSSQGVERAVTALNTIKTVAPDLDFMIAYIIFNDDGIVINSHIVDTSQVQEVAQLDGIAVGSARQKALQEVSEKIISLLKKNNNEPVPEFNRQIAQLIKEYESLDKMNDPNGIYQGDKPNGMENFDKKDGTDNLDSTNKPNPLDNVDDANKPSKLDNIDQQN